MLYGLDQLIAVLSDEEYTTEQKEDLSHRAQNFFETLTRVRKQDYFEKFPHIKESVA